MTNQTPAAGGDLVERVARAICEAGGRGPDTVTLGSGGVGYSPDGSTYSTSEIHQRAWQQHVGQARAAIEAMREPTEAMIAARQKSCFYLNEIDRSDDAENLKDAWQDMLRAALQESKP